MLKIERFKNNHHFNPYTLVHEYSDDKITRKWEDSKDNLLNEYKLDGTMSLKDMKDDIIRCFCFTGACYEEEVQYDLFKTIYETKLPFGTKVRRYDTGMVCTGVVEMLKSSTAKDIIPKNYYELFSIIGMEDCYPYEKIETNEYTVYRYPDSVMLHLNIENDTIFYGYCR